MGYAADALDAVSRVLATQPIDRVPLVAELGPDRSEIVIRSKADGRRHLVGVLLGEDYLSVGTAFHRHETANGLTFSGFGGMRQAPAHRRIAFAFMTELSAALDASPDAFAPVAGPGHGVNPFARLAVEHSARAVSAYNADLPVEEHIKLALNADGQIEGEDVVTFVRPDGTSSPIRVFTIPEGVSAQNVETGELLFVRLAERAEPDLAYWIGVSLADAETAAPRP